MDSMKGLVFKDFTEDMSEDFKAYYEKYKPSLYGAFAKFKAFYSGKDLGRRDSILTEAYLKFLELYNSGETDEKVIFYRIMEALDLYTVEYRFFQDFPVELSSYMKLSFRSLNNKGKDLDSWTIEWIMEQDYRGKFSLNRALIMMKIRNILLGREIHHINKYEVAGVSSTLPSLPNTPYVVMDTTNTDLGWVYSFCRNEEEVKMMELFANGVEGATEVARILGLPNRNKVRHMIKMVRKQMLEQGITPEIYKDLLLTKEAVPHGLLKNLSPVYKA